MLLNNVDQYINRKNAFNLLFYVSGLTFSAQLFGTETTDEYQLVWADEFDYKGLPDPSKWGYEVGYIRNNELQYYTEANRQNAFVRNGHLYITARRPRATYPKITSASLTTENIVDWTYGKIEVRAQLPTSEGDVACNLDIGQ